MEERDYDRRRDNRAVSEPGDRVVGVDVDHLRAFLAVAEELSFTRAAARLYLGSSRLSRRIRELERRLGVPLFERTTRRVELSPAGPALVPRARDVVERFDALGWAVRADTARRTEVDVGFGPGVHAADRRALVDAVQRAEPSCRVVPHSGSNDELGSGVRSGALELALLHSLEVSGVATWPVREEEFGVAVAAGHPLAARDRVPIGALRGLRYV